LLSVFLRGHTFLTAKGIVQALATGESASQTDILATHTLILLATKQATHALDAEPLQQHREIVTKVLGAHSRDVLQRYTVALSHHASGEPLLQESLLLKELPI